MSWWTKKLKKIGKNIVKASQTKVGKLVTGQSFLEGMSDGVQKMAENIANPLGSIQNMIPNPLGAAAMQQNNNNADSSNTQPLANPTSTASENSEVSQQSEQGMKKITGSSDNPGKYASVNNGGVYYGL